MSRIGRMPIPVPAGVQVQLHNSTITVKGPKGELTRTVPREMQIEMQDGAIVVKRPTDQTQHRALHGLTRTLIANMVTGVTSGYSKTLVLHGVGYRVAKMGDRLSLQLGFSHPVEIALPPEVQIGAVESFTPTQANEWLSGRFTLTSTNKELLGEVAAKIRALREPEPYKGKGIRYLGERVRRKAGKAAGKGKK